MKHNQEYKDQALDALRGNWTNPLLCTLVLMLLTYFLSFPYIIGNLVRIGQITLDFVNPFYLSGGGIALYILLLFPLSIGVLNAYNRFYLYGEQNCLENMFKETFNGYGRNVLASLLMYVYVILWTLLLIIPGIVKVFSYAMTPYIIKEHPEISVDEAIDMSRAMMKGRKFDLFYLHISFIGWWILSIMTLGIGFIWLVPYVMTAQASFYEDVKQDYLAKVRP